MYNLWPTKSSRNEIVVLSPQPPRPQHRIGKRKGRCIGVVPAFKYFEEIANAAGGNNLLFIW